VPQSASRIPQPAVSRLSIYLRCLRSLVEQGVQTISSARMGQHCGVPHHQIRKDLSYLGEFGKPGIGYDVKHLLERLTETMQLNREHRVVIVGAGNLGAALAGYAGFQRSPFRIVGIFDNNLSKIGRRLWELEIFDIHQIEQINRHLRADIGIIAVPSDSAQEVADALVAAGIRAVLNFAPARVHVPAEIALRDVDLTRELEILAFHINRVPEAAAS